MKKPIDVSGMGKAAVTTHGSGLKHKRHFAIKFSNPSILGFLNRVPSLNSTSTSAHENINKESNWQKKRKVTDHDKRKKRLREEISGDEEKHRFLKKEIAQLKLVSTHIVHIFE